MKCAACNNEMVKKKGEIDLRIGGKREHYRFINIVADSLRVWESLRLLVLDLMNRSCFFL